MKLRELIEKLSEYPADYDVAIYSGAWIHVDFDIEVSPENQRVYFNA